MSEKNKNMLNIQNKLSFKIEPCGDIDFDKSAYKKLSFAASQKLTADMFASLIMLLVPDGVPAKAYAVKIPEAVRLMQHKNTLNDIFVGKYNDKAALNNFLPDIQVQIICSAVFSAVTAAVGQYFLEQANSVLYAVNQKFDKALLFMHGEKKADLVSEISFVQYACKNFITIMEHNDQRIAAVSNLQSVKHTVMRDIEYFLYILDEKVEEASQMPDNILDLANDALEIKETLDVLIQLYIMSTIMESYYAKNNDDDYLVQLNDDTLYYVESCRSRVLSAFGKFNNHRVDSVYRKISETIQQLNSIEESKVYKIKDFILKNPYSIKEFYINDKAEIYISVQ